MFANSSQIFTDYKILKSGNYSKLDCIKLMKKAIFVTECIKIAKLKILQDESDDQIRKLECINVYQTHVDEIMNYIALKMKSHG